MIIESLYDLGEFVKIKNSSLALDIDGDTPLRGRVIYIEAVGQNKLSYNTLYRVEYWANKELKSVTLYEDELEKEDT